MRVITPSRSKITASKIYFVDIGEGLEVGGIVIWWLIGCHSVVIGGHSVVIGRHSVVIGGYSWLFVVIRGYSWWLVVVGGYLFG